MRKKFSTAVLGALVASSMTLAPNVLAATTPSDVEPQNVTVSDCLLDSTVNPLATVDEVNAKGRTFKLLCGHGATAGARHIQAGHPIIGNEIAFKECYRGVLIHGTGPEPGSYPEAEVWRYNIGPGEDAIVSTDSVVNEVNTAFTTGPAGNNWGGCAAAVPPP